MFGGIAQPAGGDTTIWVPAKVLTGKEGLDIFMQNWHNSGGQAFNGEIDVPESQNPERLMSVSPDRISHLVLDVDEKSFDAEKSTVPIKIRLCGPHGPEALERYIAKDLRFVTRLVNGVDKDKRPVSRIVTFDAVIRPDAKPINKHIDRVKARREQAKWEAEHAKKK